MPELPEVESVKNGLQMSDIVLSKIVDIQHSQFSLREEFSPDLYFLKSKNLLNLQRRAKFILFNFGELTLINHLGMTGSWRVEEVIGPAINYLSKKHDHLALIFSNGKVAIYNDPRRFGLVTLQNSKILFENKWLKNLGVEPLIKEFNGQFLFEISRNKNTPVKLFIMDQKIVVGVGNIYASEALFRSEISPFRRAMDVTFEEYEHLADEIQFILQQAIAAGGSTIRDYKNAKGEMGSYQDRFLVYGKNEQPCPVCAHEILKATQQGRSTFYCQFCQK